MEMRLIITLLIPQFNIKDTPTQEFVSFKNMKYNLIFNERVFK